MTNKKREIKKSSELRFTRKELDSFFLYEAEQFSEGYERSGWRLYKIADIYYITYFSHCSCYDTWDEITISECVTNKSDFSQTYKYRLAYLWKGSNKELRDFSTKRLDPYIHDREISCKDYEFDSLYKLYKWIDSNIRPEVVSNEAVPTEDNGIVSNEFISAAINWSTGVLAKNGLVRANPSDTMLVQTVRVSG